MGLSATNRLRELLLQVIVGDFFLTRGAPQLEKRGARGGCGGPQPKKRLLVAVAVACRWSKETESAFAASRKPWRRFDLELRRSAKVREARRKLLRGHATAETIAAGRCGGVQTSAPRWTAIAGRRKVAGNHEVNRARGSYSLFGTGIRMFSAQSNRTTRSRSIWNVSRYATPN